MIKYKVQFGDDSGITDIVFEHQLTALAVAEMLKGAIGVDSVMVWYWPPEDGDEDADVIFDWTKGQI